MGEVYEARDPRLKRTVAIKVLLDDLSNLPEVRAHFEREAQAIAGLNHPHIATLHDIGRHELTDFLVMESIAIDVVINWFDDVRRRVPASAVKIVRSSTADNCGQDLPARSPYSQS